MPNPDRSARSDMRTSVRLSLQFTFLYAVLSAGIFAIAYVFTQFEVQGWIEDQMQSDARTLSALYEKNGGAELITTIDALSFVSFEKTRLYQLQDADGNVLSGNFPIRLPSELPGQITADDSRLSVPNEFEVNAYWLREDKIGPYRLIQGAGNHLVAEILEALGAALILGYLTVILLGLIIGVRVGRITEHRITAIYSTLAEVSSGRMTARVPLPQTTRDDLSRVSSSINSMLDQVERLLESQQQIANDIAHDLRTPLQRLRQRLERMSEKTVIEPEDLSACQSQTDDIIRTFNALLRIAQIEAGNRHSGFETVSFGDLVLNIADVFEPALTDAGISLNVQDIDPSAEVEGDRNLLGQLVSNLIENVITHCPFGTKVDLSVAQSNQSTALRITDNGPGIASENHERVFRRFFRTEQSRHTPGHGLGLTLVKAIAELHGASVTIENANPGTVFEVRFALDLPLENRAGLDEPLRDQSI